MGHTVRPIHIIAGCAAVALAAACGGAPDASDAGIPEPTVRDSAGVLVVENRLPQGPTPEYAVVSDTSTHTLDRPTEGVPGWSSPDIRAAVTLSDGRTAVVDAGSFRVRYYRGGEVVWAPGGRGTDPTEFLAILGAGRAGGDTVWVHDPQKGTVTFLDPAGVESVVARVTTGGLVVGRFGGGSFLVARPRDTEREPGVRRPTVDYLRWWPATGDSARVGAFPGTEQLTLDTGAGDLITVPAPLARGTSIAVGPGRLYVGDQERFEILGMDADGTLRQRIRLEGLDLGVTQELLDRLVLTDDEGGRPEWAGDYWAHAPETRPAFGRLVLDALGNLWVAEHVATGRPATTWVVFSPEGRLLGRVDVPADLTLLEIGVGYLLAVDPLQRVHRYGLERRSR